MAIDMIEKNDLGALASGRLGDLTQFADESNIFKNFTGNEEVFDKIDVNEEFENLFGSKAHKDSKARTKVEAENFVRSLPKTSCDNLKFSLEKLALYIEAETKGLGLAKGRMTEYPKIRLSVARTAEADLKMKHKPMTTESAMAKYYASEVCVYAATEAVQIFGGYGYTKDFPVEKFYRDSKLCTIGEGTSEIQKLVIARNILRD